MRALLVVAVFVLGVICGSGYILVTAKPHVTVQHFTVYVGAGGTKTYTSIEPCPPWAIETRMNASETWPGDLYVCTIGPRAKFIWLHAQRDQSDV